jgi:RIO kinase 1
LPSHKHDRTPDLSTSDDLGELRELGGFDQLEGLSTPDDPGELEDLENLDDSADLEEYGEYDDYYLSDDADYAQRIRGRSLLSENEQKAEKKLLRRGRLTDRERERLVERREEAQYARSLPEGADRWSTWGEGELGPEPRPPWLVVADGAVDSRLGVVKTGKEADVHLVERWLPEQAGAMTDGYEGEEGHEGEEGEEGQSWAAGQTGQTELAGRRAAEAGAAASCLLAEKIYRGNDHRNFHRDAGYLDGRRTRESRLDRAVANRTSFGLKVIAEQWAVAEFAALSLLWSAGAPVPYPVQRVGTELLLEFVGDADGTAAPRLAALRPDPDTLADLWGQLCAGLAHVARAGYAHGDLSAYNILVHDGRLVLIDLPQIVDLAANPHSAEYLRRDVANIVSWFASRGLADAERRGADLLEELRYEARLV